MPGLFEQFPHTNLHELNLDWMIDLLNTFKQELEDRAVISVNGMTGEVVLYESENVILPALPSGVDQWRLVRLVNGQYVGILFYNGHAYLQRGNETMRLLTLEDIPTSSGVVSWNGMTGVVNATGENIPINGSSQTTVNTEIQTIKQNLLTLSNKMGRIISSGSLRNITEPGIYWLTSGVTDKPETTAGAYILSQYTADYQAGLFISADSDHLYCIRHASDNWEYEFVPFKKSYVVTATTSATGAIEVDLAYRGYVFIGGYLSTGGPGYITRRDESFFTVYNNSGQILANTPVSFVANFLA